MSIILKILPFTVIIVGCCSLKKTGKQDILEKTMQGYKKPTGSFLVRSITLEDSTYLIYAVKEDSVFKIVSPLREPLFVPPFLKKKSETCSRIVVGSYYNFKIKSIFEFQFGTIDAENNRRSHRSMGPHLKAIRYNGTAISLEAESHYDIYAVENLRGLCYLNSDSLAKNSK